MGPRELMFSIPRNPSVEVSLAVISTSVIVYQFLRVVVSKYLRSLTLLPELELLNCPRAEADKVKGTVVIAGGSFAGLWTACVCSDHFERVLVVDADGWTSTEEGVKTPVHMPVTKRARVFQYNSFHGYQTFALRALRRFFPTWDDELKSEGGIIGKGFLPWHFNGMPFASDSRTSSENLMVSRPTYETLFRRLVRKRCPNVEFIAGTVTGIKVGEDRSKIVGVTVKRKAGENEPDLETVLSTVLFIDCAGPTHLGLKWLSAAGYGNQSSHLKNAQDPLSHLLTSYKPKLAYSTSYWPVTPSQIARVAALVPKDPNTAWHEYDPVDSPFLYGGVPDSNIDCHNGGIGWVEGNRYMILCGGWGDIHLARSPEEITEYFRAVHGVKPIPEWIFQALEIIYESGEGSFFETLRVQACSRVSYSKASELPSNFIAIGDATMRLNPVFGQGISKALMGAVLLNAQLRQLPIAASKPTLPSDFASKFFKTYDRRVAEPLWNETRFRDYGFASTIPTNGETHDLGKSIRWFEKKFLQTCTWDAESTAVFNEVRHFLQPTAALLFKPTIVMKILWEILTSKSSRVHGKSA